MIQHIIIAAHVPRFSRTHHKYLIYVTRRRRALNFFSVRLNSKNEKKTTHTRDRNSSVPVILPDYSPPPLNRSPRSQSWIAAVRRRVWPNRGHFDREKSVKPRRSIEEQEGGHQVGGDRMVWAWDTWSLSAGGLVWGAPNTITTILSLLIIFLTFTIF